jgi:hypothetical protein
LRYDQDRCTSTPDIHIAPGSASSSRATPGERTNGLWHVIYRPIDNLTLTANAATRKRARTTPSYARTMERSNLSGRTQWPDGRLAVITDWRLSADYRFSPAVLAYDGGHRLGGSVTARPHAAGTQQRFDPSRYRVRGGTEERPVRSPLRLNISAFYNDYEDAAAADRCASLEFEPALRAARTNNRKIKGVSWSCSLAACRTGHRLAQLPDRRVERDRCRQCHPDQRPDRVASGEEAWASVQGTLGNGGSLARASTPTPARPAPGVCRRSDITTTAPLTNARLTWRNADRPVDRLEAQNVFDSTTSRSASRRSTASRHDLLAGRPAAGADRSARSSRIGFSCLKGAASAGRPFSSRHSCAGPARITIGLRREVDRNYSGGSAHEPRRHRFREPPRYCRAPRPFGMLASRLRRGPPRGVNASDAALVDCGDRLPAGEARASI